MNVEARLQQIEELLQLLLGRSPSTFGSGTLLAVPNDNVRKDVVTMPVDRTVPYLVRVLFIIRDPTTGDSMWSELRSEINGDPAAPTILATQSEFQFIQPGFANPPTVLVTTSGSNYVAQIQNPVAGNPIDVIAYIVDYRIGIA